jgi:hypothetical protein
MFLLIVNALEICLRSHVPWFFMLLLTGTLNPEEYAIIEFRVAVISSFHELTSWSKVLYEKRLVLNLVKKLSPLTDPESSLLFS